MFSCCCVAPMVYEHTTAFPEACGLKYLDRKRLSLVFMKVLKQVLCTR